MAKDDITIRPCHDLIALAAGVCGDPKAAEVARHESGHAVVGLVLGLPVKAVWVRCFDRAWCGRVDCGSDPEDARRHLTMTVAGPLAQGVGYRLSDGFLERESHDALSATWWAEWALRLHPADDELVVRMVQQAEVKAERILRRHWRAVIKLSRSLLRRRTHRLTRSQVLRLIGHDLGSLPVRPEGGFFARLSQV